MSKYEIGLIEVKKKYNVSGDKFELQVINNNNYCDILLGKEKEKIIFLRDSSIKLKLKDINGKLYNKEIFFREFDKKELESQSSNNIKIKINDISKEIELSEFNLVNEFSNNLENSHILIGIKTEKIKYEKILDFEEGTINLEYPYKIKVVLNDSQKTYYEIIATTMCKIEFIEESKSIINIKIKDGENDYSKNFHYKELISSSI